MATPSQGYQRIKSYFHGLSKVNTEATQYVFESQYKSAHSVKGDDIWAEEIVYATNETEADDFVSNYPLVAQKYVLFDLTPIPGSNNQAYYLNDGGQFVTSWISPVDVPHSTSALPSFGYEAKLYQSNNSLIPPTQGVFVIDYYAGIVLFEEGYTPIDLGYGIPKISCYTYIGKKGFANADNELNVQNLDIDEGTTEVVDSFDINLSDACIWDYVIKRGYDVDNDRTGYDVRTGTIKACWNHVDQPEYYEDATPDLGNTEKVNLLVDWNAGNIRLLGSVLIDGGDNWKVKAIRRTLM